MVRRCAGPLPMPPVPSMEHQLQAIATILSLVNPVICGAMFARIEAGQARAVLLADATKAALAVLVILVVAALAGARVLQVFGVSLDAFSVAGGGVLAWIGFSMLRGDSAPVPATKAVRCCFHHRPIGFRPPRIGAYCDCWRISSFVFGLHDC